MEPGHRPNFAFWKLPRVEPFSSGPALLRPDTRGQQEPTDALPLGWPGQPCATQGSVLLELYSDPFELGTFPNHTSQEPITTVFGKASSRPHSLLEADWLIKTSQALLVLTVCLNAA